MIGYTIWETYRLPTRWPGLFAAIDAIVVPSLMNAEVFRHSGVSCPVHQVPHVCRQSWSRNAGENVIALRRRLGIPDNTSSSTR